MKCWKVFRVVCAHKKEAEEVLWRQSGVIVTELLLVQMFFLGLNIHIYSTRY